MHCFPGPIVAVDLGVKVHAVHAEVGVLEHEAAEHAGGDETSLRARIVLRRRHELSAQGDSCRQERGNNNGDGRHLCRHRTGCIAVCRLVLSVVLFEGAVGSDDEGDGRLRGGRERMFLLWGFLRIWSR